MSRSDQLIPRNIDTSNDGGQAQSAFVARLKEALAGRSVAWLAKESGVNDGTLRNYMKGAQPTIIPAVQIALALGVSLDWLIAGVGPRPKEEAAKQQRADRAVGRELFDVTEADWVFLPHYSFESAFDSFAPIIRETYPVRRDWLNNALGTAKGLWMTEMPGADLPEVAGAGQTVICRNSADLTLGKAFVLGVDGHLIVRRLSMRDGHLAFTSDLPDARTIALSDDYIPVGQILARYGVSPVHANAIG